MATKSFVLKVCRLKTLGVSKSYRTILSSPNDRSSFFLAMAGSRPFSKSTITPDISFITYKPVSLQKNENQLPKVTLGENRTLVLYLPFLKAKEKQKRNVTDVYLKFGFDVLEACVSPQQLLWPMKGAQLIAQDIAKFLVSNPMFSPIVVHGFSVGCYLWGEIVVEFSKNLSLYQPVIDRISGQLFDSPLDLEELQNVLPQAMFRNKPLLRFVAEKYLDFHIKNFYEIATKHYFASRRAFSSNVVKCPMLLFTSEGDTFGSLQSCEKVIKEMTALNLDVSMKLFPNSGHIMHFKNYPEEYIAEIEKFLAKVKVLPSVNTQAKL